MSFPKITSISEPAFQKGNEDFVLTSLHRGDPQLELCFLADGQGGRAGGAEAAETACRSALETAEKFGAEALLLPMTWIEILTQADKIASGQCEGFTTLIGFAAGDRSVCGASSGDSKVYFKAGGKVAELTGNQKKNPPVGSGSAIITPFSFLCDSETILLAATDGVWKFCGFEAIEGALERNAADPVGSLRKTVLDRQGGRLPDDFSAIRVDWCQGVSLASDTPPALPGSA